MRSLEQRIKNLETRVKRLKKPDEQYCTEHFPEARLILTEEDERRLEEEEKAGTLYTCKICGKPFHPNGPKLAVIYFHDTEPHEENEG